MLCDLTLGLLQQTKTQLLTAHMTHTSAPPAKFWAGCGSVTVSYPAGLKVSLLHTGHCDLYLPSNCRARQARIRGECTLISLPQAHTQT